MEAKPLIVIIGPTASGKTSLAIALAKKIHGEIICADSRTVYRHMNIGTAKPSLEEREGVPHWGLDIVNPDQRYTVAEFKEYANRKISEIRQRNHVPILVGGSGLYIDAVVFDYRFREQANPVLRHELEGLSVDELKNRCEQEGIQIPHNHMNRRHLIRAIEQKGINRNKRVEPIMNSYIFGVQTEKKALRERIEKRADVMFQNGVVQEAADLAERYGWNHESMTGNIYPLCRSYLEGLVSLDEAKDKFIVLDWHLVKRQLTWFRRNPHIVWLQLHEAEKCIISLLDSEQKS